MLYVMHALSLLLALALPARAGVAVSAEAGSNANVPKISLQTSLSPMSGPAFGAARARGLNAAIAAPSAAPIPGPAAMEFPAPLAPAAIAPAALEPAVGPAAPGRGRAAASALKQVLSAAPAGGDGKDHAPDPGALLFDGAAANEEAASPVSGFRQGETTVEPRGLGARLKKALRSIGDAVGPPLLRSQYDDNSRSHYYHGVSLGTLEKAIDDGGSLKAKLTFISDEAGHPYGYARTSARRTGTAGVVLQFEKHLLDPLIVPGHYNPRAPERGEKWEDVPHWYQADRDIPLTAQTPLSKKTVLDWLAERRDASPNDASWAGRIAKFEKAFGAKAPAPKPRPDPNATDHGRLGLDGLSLKGSRWLKDGRILDRLGRGSIGFVTVHPARPGLIMKTIQPSFEQALGGLDIKDAIAHDEASAKVLADAGVGPAFLGAAVLEGRRVSVRERVFGKTLSGLIHDRAFGAEEEALVLDMVRRMAAKGVLVSDLKPENIMIGSTERDPERRAWFVDGGVVEKFPDGLDEEGRARMILDYPNVIAMRNDHNARQVVETVRTLRFFIADGREDSSLPRWGLFWKRFKQSLLLSGLAAANK